MQLRSLRFALSAFITAILLGSCAGASSTIPNGATSDFRPLTGSGCGSKCCPSLPGGTGILTDGDFSQGIDLGSKWNHVFKGDVFAPNWIVSKSNINFYGSTAWNIDGLCSVDLDGTPGPGGIAHDFFATQVGAQYSVTFLFSGNGACRTTAKKMQVEAAKQSEDFTWNTSGGKDAQNGYWSEEVFQFSAINSMTRVRFNSKDHPPSNCGPVVAGVSVNPTSSTSILRKLSMYYSLTNAAEVISTETPIHAKSRNVSSLEPSLRRTRNAPFGSLRSLRA